MVHKYFLWMETIGSFARVTDVTLKSDGELIALHGAGYDGLTIGIETADDEALRFMDKGYLAADILEQCGRLDQASNAFQIQEAAKRMGRRCMNWYRLVRNVTLKF